MKTFEEVMTLTRTVSSPTALSDEEARALYEACTTVGFGGTVVEVGCQLGRSSSLIAQMAVGQFGSIHVDPFTDQPDFLRQWHEMMCKIGGRDHCYTHLCMRTHQAQPLLSLIGGDELDLVYIDGDHEYPGVLVDLKILCPMLRGGGLLLMHDYGRDSLPGIYKAAQEYLNPKIPRKWEHLGVAGTMSTWRRR